jgi:hypothetical protein
VVLAAGPEEVGLIGPIGPILFAPAEDAGDGGEHFGGGGEGCAAGGERVVRAGGFMLRLSARLAPFVEGGEGGAAGAAFDGAAGDVGQAEAVQAQAGIFHHAAGHVDHEAGLELGVEDVFYPVD